MRKLVTGMLAAVVTLGIGIAVGQFLGGRAKQRDYEALKASAPTALLAPGDRFPTVDLMAGAGHHVVSDELVRDGAVVLFIDLECPPCTDAVLAWGDAAVQGQLVADRLFGIAYHSLAAIDAYRRDNDISFPIYRDYDGVFLHEYEVNRFPLLVAVDGGGRIKLVAYDIASVDAAALSATSPGE